MRTLYSRARAPGLCSQWPLVPEPYGFTYCIKFQIRPDDTDGTPLCTPELISLVKKLYPTFLEVPQGVTKPPCPQDDRIMRGRLNVIKQPRLWPLPVHVGCVAEPLPSSLLHHPFAEPVPQNRKQPLGLSGPEHARYVVDRSALAWWTVADRNVVVASWASEFSCFFMAQLLEIWS